MKGDLSWAVLITILTSHKLHLNTCLLYKNFHIPFYFLIHNFSFLINSLGVFARRNPGCPMKGLKFSEKVTIHPLSLFFFYRTGPRVSEGGLFLSLSLSLSAIKNLLRNQSNLLLAIPRIPFNPSILYPYQVVIQFPLRKSAGVHHVI
jgi:hypothetical protein